MRWESCCGCSVLVEPSGSEVVKHQSRSEPQLLHGFFETGFLDLSAAVQAPGNRRLSHFDFMAILDCFPVAMGT